MISLNSLKDKIFKLSTMKAIKMTVKRVETPAWDIQQAHCEGSNCQAVLELKTGHDIVKAGDEVTISISSTKVKGK